MSEQSISNPGLVGPSIPRQRPDIYQRREPEPGQRRKALLYLRVSQTKGRVGRDDYHSEDQQLRAVTGCAEQHNLEIVDTIIDRNKTGGDLKRLEPVISRIESGEADALVVYKTNRFARTLRAQYEIISRLLECGGDLIAAREYFDIYSQQGRWMINMLLQTAEAELEANKDYWWEVHAANVAAGISNAKAPYGYRKQNLDEKTGIRTGPLEPDPDTADYAREVFLKRGSGSSWAEVANWLNDNGQRTPAGNRFGPQMLRNMVNGRVYRGEVSFGELMRNSNAHQPLITEEEWQLAQDARGPRPSRSENHDGHLLSGLARCAYCRYCMQHSTCKGRQPTYHCRGNCAAQTGRGCSSPVSISAAKLEAYVETAILDWAKQEQIKARRLEAGDAVAEKLRANVEKWEHRYEVWTSDPANLDDGAKFVKQRDSLRFELENARKKLQAHTFLHRHTLVDDDTLELWEKKELPIPERRKLLSAVVGAVFIVKAKPQTNAATNVEDRVLIITPDDLPALPKQGPGAVNRLGPVPGIELPDGTVAPPDPLPET